MRNNKLLFISCNDFDDKTYGGGQCSNRNYKALNMLTKLYTYKIAKKSTFRSFLSIISRYFPPVDFKDWNNIKNIIQRKEIDIVFFDGSIFGVIVDKIKKKFPDVKIVTFFHNIEVDYVDVRFGNKKRKYIYHYLAKRSEKKHSKKSEKIITLNERDSKRLFEIYNRKSDNIIPITFDDYLTKKDLKDMKKKSIEERKKNCLFVGSLSRDTFEGISWFVKNVSPNIKVNTDIIGKNFEKKRKSLESEKVNVIGTVDSLKKYYKNSSCVILPILSGAGMKVKTAEALMFGKEIFGTEEAFEGYDIDFKKVGGLCNNANEFIEKINYFVENDDHYFNNYSRNIFEEKYSSKVSFALFERIINELK